MTNKLDLSRLTYITVAGKQPTEEKLKRYSDIVAYANRYCAFGAIKLLTVADPRIDGAQWCHIDPLDYAGYNRFCLTSLHEYVDTDYALVFQDDGFIVNPDNWTSDFLNYDYIGAPWREYYGQDRQVGNGGFSLRSRKLMKLLAPLPYPGGNEDGVICHRHRSFIEAHSMSVAPIEVARRFSVERPLDSEHTAHITFGIHCYAGPELSSVCPEMFSH